MKKKIKFEEHEYDRLMFLKEIIGENKYSYIQDNILFFKNLEERNQNLHDERNKTFIDGYLFDSKLDLIYKTKEFFEIYEEFNNKFKNIYGVSQRVLEYKHEENIHRKMVEDLYFVYLPLSRYLYKQSFLQRKFNNKPIICGLQAQIGCGKTTTSEILKFILKNVYNMNTEVLSIDDVYKTCEEFKELKERDNRFKYRGPPGTHDLNLATGILENVKRMKTNFYLPRYNKALHGGLGNRVDKGVYISKPIEVLLFEGWFLGSDPVEESELEESQTNKDKLQFQKHINKLLIDYQNLWNYVDFWVILKPKKFEYSKQWRTQAEKRNKQGMKWKQMQDFINYFWLAQPPHIYFSKIEYKRNPILTITLDKHRNFLI